MAARPVRIEIVVGTIAKRAVASDKNVSQRLVRRPRDVWVRRWSTNRGRRRRCYCVVVVVDAIVATIPRPFHSRMIRFPRRRRRLEECASLPHSLHCTWWLFGLLFFVFVILRCFVLMNLRGLIGALVKTAAMV